MKALSRRKFLQLSSSVSAVAAGAPLFASRADAAISEADLAQVDSQWIPSCCNMCGGQSGILCRVVNGRLVKIEPNPYNPNNFSNISTDFFQNVEKEGTCICPKGNAGMYTLYDKDRIKTPLRRTHPEKGVGVDPGFKAISWEEAYTEIVKRLAALREAGEAHKLLWFSEDHSFTHIQGDFCQLYGTPNYFMHSNLCDTARKASFKMVMGADRPLMDAVQSKYILLFGWNPLSATKWSHLPRIITRGIENGAKLVVVDPYCSFTANKAHEWIPIRPATDGALALAMGHVIIRDKLYDEAFVKDWTAGFDQYAGYVKDKTPEWAETITSVPARTITRIATEFAATKPQVVDVWSGPGQHSNGVQGGRAIALLAALVGGYDRAGTLIIPDKKGNKHIHLHEDEQAKKTLAEKIFDEGKAVYPFGHSSGVYCESFSRLAEGKGPYKPKIGMIIFQNVMMSVPGTKTVEKALKNLEFLVVNDIFLSETALMADIVIPGTLYLERYDLNTHWVTWPVLGLRQPVVKPIFGQPTEYEFVVELGRRLNIQEHDGKDFFWTGRMSGARVEDKTRWYEEFLSGELKEGEPKITLEELKKLPGAVWVSKTGTAYEKFAKPIKSKLVVEGDKVFDKPADDPKRKQVAVVMGEKLVRPLGNSVIVDGKVTDKDNKTVGWVDGEKVFDKAADTADRKEIGLVADGKALEPVGIIVEGQAFFAKGKTILDKPAADKGAQIGTLIDGKPLRGFFTPSGKCEFYNTDLAKKKDALGKPVDPLPAYTPRDWMPDAAYPLYLINWKECSHTHSRTQNNRMLMELTPSSPLMINTETAKKMGLKDRDEVWVESKYGKVKAQINLTEGIHPEVVGLQHGFGHWAFGTVAKGAGTSDSGLRPCRADPFAGQALHKECCVRVSKA